MALRTGTSLPGTDGAGARPLAGASIVDVLRGSRRPGELALALGVTFVVAVVYLLSTPPSQPLAYFVPLADAFLHGRIYVTEAPSWLSELVPATVGWYVPYPPMPAVFLLPFVALFGPDVPQQIVSALVGAASTGLLFLAIGRLGLRGRARGRAASSGTGRAPTRTAGTTGTAPGSRSSAGRSHRDAGGCRRSTGSRGRRRSGPGGRPGSSRSPGRPGFPSGRCCRARTGRPGLPGRRRTPSQDGARGARPPG